MAVRHRSEDLQARAEKVHLDIINIKQTMREFVELREYEEFKADVQEGYATRV